MFCATGKSSVMRSRFAAPHAFPFLLRGVRTKGMTPEQIAPALDAVETAVSPFVPAALFTLAKEGYDTLFEVVVACIVSVRTLEADTLAVSRRVLSVARTPTAVAALPEDDLLALLSGSTFPEPKARQIVQIAKRTLSDFGGTLPADYDTLLSLPGVGAKCAALSLGVSTGETPHTPVDTHVHRVANRWGVAETKTPEKTMIALDALLSPPDRVRINRLLVPFGKYVCTGGTLPPRCSTCPLSDICEQVGVARKR